MKLPAEGVMARMGKSRGRRVIHRTHTDGRFRISLSCNAVLVLFHFQTAADFSPAAVMLGWQRTNKDVRIAGQSERYL